MKLLLKADPLEFSEKSEQLTQKLAELFADIAPDISEALEKALPKPEPILKYPVLQALYKQTKSIYDQHIQSMLVDIYKVLDQSIVKSGWVELDEIYGENLYKALSHKYVKRVPYTDNKGKQHYRYYYSESALARQAQTGEKVKLGDTHVKVLKITKDSITIEDDNGQHTISHSKWSEKIAEIYPAYYAQQEKRAKQALNAITTFVPLDLLKDLAGKTDRSKLQDLKKRVPEVYSRISRAFSRAGIDPIRAKQIIADTLKRKGWEKEAKAVVLGSVFTPKGLKRAISYKDVLAGAENLAGNKTVKPIHAQTAVDLADKSATDIAKKAEQEILRLQQLMQQVKEKPEQAANLLAEIMNSEALIEMNSLAKAYPGIKDRAKDIANKTVLEAPSVAPRTEPMTEGSKTSIILAGEGGKPTVFDGQYRIIEADDLIASHDPTKSFSKREEYPQAVQERAYHRDKAEQDKVHRNARRFDPRFVINTNPDAINGPPIVTDDNIVLGGNSRSMSMQLLYKDYPERAAQFKKYLTDHAHEIGLKDIDIQAMKNPILVRSIEVPEKNKENLQVLVRQMNESFTQSMDPATMQVALARKLDDKALAALTGNMQEDETLNAFLLSSRASAFIQNLQRTGIIDERNYNQFFKANTKKLNQDGIALVSRILVGRMLDNADLLSETRPQLLNSLARSVPYMVQALKAGKGYDLGPSVQTAMSAINRIQDKVEAGLLPPLKADMPERNIGILLNSEFADMFGDRHPILDDMRAQELFRLFIRKSGPIQMAKIFKNYAQLALKNPENQASLLETKSPLEIFKDSITLEKSGVAYGRLTDRNDSTGQRFGSGSDEFELAVISTIRDNNRDGSRTAIEETIRRSLENDIIDRDGGRGSYQEDVRGEISQSQRAQETLAKGTNEKEKTRQTADTSDGFFDTTKELVEKEQATYDKIKDILLDMGYKATAFEENGIFYGWSVNQLIEYIKQA